MAQQEKVPDAKPFDLILIPGNHTVEGEDWLPHTILQL